MRRLAPMSEGRIHSDGTLMCSYHGWRFQGDGACVDIPQSLDAKADATARASPRSCIKAHPVKVCALCHPARLFRTDDLKPRTMQRRPSNAWQQALTLVGLTVRQLQVYPLQGEHAEQASCCRSLRTRCGCGGTAAPAPS